VWENNMNFIWRETNGEDKKIFNDWHKKAKLKNNDYDNISVFLQHLFQKD